MWNDGEKKLQKIISFLWYEKASGKDSVRRKDKAPAAQFPTDIDDEWSGCSDNEPDTGGRNAVEVEPAKEEATVSCTTSKKKAQNPKNKNKSKKRGGKKWACSALVAFDVRYKKKK